MKTKLITLEIPEDQRLGQAIMNAYRDRWIVPLLGQTPILNIWNLDKAEIQDAINKLAK